MNFILTFEINNVQGIQKTNQTLLYYDIPDHGRYNSKHTCFESQKYVTQIMLNVQYFDERKI